MALKLIIALLGAATVAWPVTAQQVPNEGCYARTYSKAHLAETPNQGVARIRMRVFQPIGSPDPLVAMTVTMSNQGQARADHLTIDAREECGGCSNLAEPGTGTTSYRLNAVSASQCDGFGF